MDLVAEWESLMENPFFNDIPYKVELNKFGQILMSPVSNWHGIVQYNIGKTIESKTGSGTIIIECSILTNEGLRVADVAWASDEFIFEFGDRTPYPKAPEICIEVKSPANMRAEMDEKIRLYLEKGALEVWIVEKSGKTSFHSHTGKIRTSKLVKNFNL